MIQFAFYQTSWNTTRWERGGWTVKPARVAGELFGRTAHHYFDETIMKAQTPWLEQFSK